MGETNSDNSIRRILRTVAVTAVLSLGSFGYAAPASAAGNLRSLRLSHPITAFQSTHPNRALTTGTVNVLAIMVQFQTDNDTLTSGNGHFVMTTGTGLNAPPHDSTYFEKHLLFLKNYFYKASEGKLNIDYTLLDSVITLPHKMQYYSPPENASDSVQNLGLLYQDAWRAADSLYPNFNFSRYQCFVIFHAGVGRDVNFAPTLGYDPFPYNIPSIYLNIKSLRAMFGPQYEGQPVDAGSFRIPNSIIMPEDEHYVILQPPDTLDLNLGTNGLLANSFGSFLGLPDLFDTKTGVTGIGTFGLMDGQSAFAYGGIFPPQPSAWSKVYLGWVTPKLVSPSVATQYTLYSNGTGKYSIIKVPISGSEYFLLENRERDPSHTGEKITTYYQGAEHTIVIPDGIDTTYFDGQQVHDIDGVVTDATSYDWALPGYSDTNTGINYYGGILIWHIDQSVIDANLATNTVNADPSHRGVAVMEAHGANEIGRLITDITGQLYYYDGSPFDFWFKGNPTPSYYNVFTPTSLPNSDSYNGSNSHVYITNFSEADSAMTFDVMVGDSTIKAAPGFPKNIHGATLFSSPVFGHIAATGLQVMANNGDSLYAFNLTGSSAVSDTTGLFSATGGAFQPVLSTSQSSSNKVFTMNDSTLYALQDNNGVVDTLFSTPADAPGTAIGQPLMRIGTKVVAFGATPGVFSVFRSDGSYLASYSIPGVNAVVSPGSDTVFPWLSRYTAVDTSSFYLVVAQGQGIFHVDLDSLLQSGGSKPPGMSPAPDIRAFSYAKLNSTSAPFLIALTDKSVLIDSTGNTPEKIFTVFPGDTIESGPVVADLTGNGSREIIFATQTKVYAISFNGTVLDGFPVSTVGSEVLPADANRIVGSIAVADLGTDGKPDVIFGTKGGELFAFSGATAKVVPGFPVSVGDGMTGSPAAAYDPQTGNVYLAAVGTDGYLYCWSLKGSSASQVQWGNLLGNNDHTNAVTGELASQPVQPTSSVLMPADQVYNWPNPVTNGMTKIRFYLNENARVTVAIYSFAGDKVAEFQINGTGGTANHVDWDTSNVQSGVYFARVDAVSSRERDVRIIKIAVVK